MNNILIILPLFIVMAIGFFAKKVSLLNDEGAAKISNLLYWVALPALLFRIVALSDLQVVSDAGFLKVSYVSFLIVPVASWVMVSIFDRKVPKERKAVSVLTSLRANNVFMGIPVISAAIGQDGLEVLTAFLAVGMVGFQTASITAGQLALSGSVSFSSFRQTCKKIVLNPLILSCLAGIAVSLLGIDALPEWFDETLKILGKTASGLALLCLGASLHPEYLLRSFRSGWKDILFKLFAHPLIVWSLFLVWPNDPVIVKTFVLASAMPIAVNNYVIAQGMGMDVKYTGEIITSSTLLSVLTIPFWIRFLHII